MREQTKACKAKFHADAGEDSSCAALLQGAEAVLMRASEQADAAGRASMYYEGVCAALVACKRLADTANDASAVVASAPSAGEPSGAPSSASTDALELERLRKELAETKVLLAEASNARDVTEHELRLEKQQSRSRSRSLFG